ncbi:TerB family tellurite resistance protein [Ideonella livida]|uniref:TerB family tellurite resistance protein n=1 Tax=Ideonella livida TaxID=2707176 RepID=A0A7C9TLZ3_9BURK|nr:TerB family tellurite resistance protein [Ideonella livida]NDY93900.1 TerB family tellurite resistance protein [Ideonella livida]
MHSYPRNSPEAAARLVALALIADGHVCRRETDALAQMHAEAQLGLPPGSLPQALRTLCEDLVLGTRSGGSVLAAIDEPMLAALMAEVDDPGLRRRVISAVAAAADADGHLAEGELRVLGALMRAWGPGAASHLRQTAH